MALASIRATPTAGQSPWTTMNSHIRTFTAEPPPAQKRGLRELKNRVEDPDYVHACVSSWILEGHTETQNLHATDGFPCCEFPYRNGNLEETGENLCVYSRS